MNHTRQGTARYKRVVATYSKAVEFSNSHPQGGGHAAQQDGGFRRVLTWCGDTTFAPLEVKVVDVCMRNFGTANDKLAEQGKATLYGFIIDSHWLQF